MTDAQIVSRMQQVVELVGREISSVRTGRVTPSLVSDIIVSVYGNTQKLKVLEVASISVTDAQTLMLSVWDKSIVGEIRQGILAANVGLNPVIDNDSLRITLPPLTGEDRLRYIKLLSVKVENGKVMIRQVRAEAMRDIKKGFEDKTITEDEKFRQEKELQKNTDEYIGKIEALAEVKTKELQATS